MGLAFSIFIGDFIVEVTENYEGDKWHVVLFDNRHTPATHEDTQGLNSPAEIFKYLRKVEDDYN
jgi:hypothetical protein|tara:strand:- start:49 stop:240 length:192 start_codon:yes stop_codon:yes gene_type:complete